LVRDFGNIVIKKASKILLLQMKVVFNKIYSRHLSPGLSNLRSQI